MITRTPLEMANRLRRKLNHPGTARHIMERLTPNGELFPLAMIYIQHFPEDLPSDVPNPAKGDLRHKDGKTSVWTGEDWM